MSEIENPIVYVLISLQRALLGEITPNIRAISCSLNDKVVSIKVYIDGPIDSELEERFSCIETEVMADFPNEIVQLEVIRCDYPEKINGSGFYRLVYERKEA